MTPEQEDNLQDIYAEIGGVMAHIEIARPDIGLAISALHELKWNNMDQEWKNDIIFYLAQAQHNLMDMVKKLGNIKLDETNCD